jgi:hypothetical protein
MFKPKETWKTITIPPVPRPTRADWRERLVAIVVGLFVLLSFVTPLIGERRYAALEDHSRPVQGEVMDYRARNGDYEALVFYRYVVDGVVHTWNQAWPDEYPRAVIGGPIEVHYLPEKPGTSVAGPLNEFLARERKKVPWSHAVGLGLLIVYLPLGIWSEIGQRKVRQLVQDGILTNAVIVKRQWFGVVYRVRYRLDLPQGTVEAAQDVDFDTGRLLTVGREEAVLFDPANPSRSRLLTSLLRFIRC